MVRYQVHGYISTDFSPFSNVMNNVSRVPNSEQVFKGDGSMIPRLGQVPYCCIPHKRR